MSQTASFVDTLDTLERTIERAKETIRGGPSLAPPRPSVNWVLVAVVLLSAYLAYAYLRRRNNPKEKNEGSLFST